MDKYPDCETCINRYDESCDDCEDADLYEDDGTDDIEDMSISEFKEWIREAAYEKRENCSI